jgi:hypothetical protein
MTTTTIARISGLFATAALMTTMGACTSTTTGADGNLKFSYYSTANARDFNKPIAIGAKLDIKVEEAGSDDMDGTIVNSVQSEDEAIIKAASAGGDTITLEATGAGSAEISVDATLSRNGEVESDRFTMRTAVPEVIELTHLCATDSNTATYLVGQKEIFLGYDMQLKDGQQVIGYGYYPVNPAPATGVSVLKDKKNHDFVRMETGADVGDVVLTSDVSEGSWTLKLVEEGAIDGALIEDVGSVGVGEEETYHVLPATMGARICQADLDFEVATLTPELCDVRRQSDEALELTKSITKKAGWIVVSGKAVGDCKFTVTYSGANEGAGVTVEFPISVESK